MNGRAVEQTQRTQQEVGRMSRVGAEGKEEKKRLSFLFYGIRSFRRKIGVQTRMTWEAEDAQGVTSGKEIERMGASAASEACNWSVGHVRIEIRNPVRLLSRRLMYIYLSQLLLLLPGREHRRPCLAHHTITAVCFEHVCTYVGNMFFYSSTSLEGLHANLRPPPADIEHMLRQMTTERSRQGERAACAWPAHHGSTP